MDRERILEYRSDPPNLKGWRPSPQLAVLMIAAAVALAVLSFLIWLVIYHLD